MLLTREGLPCTGGTRSRVVLLDVGQKLGARKENLGGFGEGKG